MRKRSNFVVHTNKHTEPNCLSSDLNFYDVKPLMKRTTRRVGVAHSLGKTRM